MSDQVAAGCSASTLCVSRSCGHHHQMPRRAHPDAQPTGCCKLLRHQVSCSGVSRKQHLQSVPAAHSPATQLEQGKPTGTRALPRAAEAAPADPSAGGAGGEPTLRRRGAPRAPRVTARGRDRRDGGVDRGLALGLHIDLAIGDFDSVSAGRTRRRGGVRRARRTAPSCQGRDRPRAGARCRDRARSLTDPRRRTSGGRLDHLLGSVSLLGLQRYAAAEIDAYLDAAVVHVVRDSRTLSGTPGELITLLPLHGGART